jgi:hypothetical protein
MTEIIAYHHKTRDIALLKTGHDYWIGCYDPVLMHQNGEPLYYWIAGNFELEMTGLMHLDAMTGDEF